MPPPLLPTPSAAATSLIRAGAGATSRIMTGGPPRVTPAAVVVVVAAAASSFSTTASRPKISKPRRQFRSWEKTVGRLLRRPRGEGPQYLPTRQWEDLATDQPFPINPTFKSTHVLDDKSRELVWTKVMRDGEPIKVVSAEFGIDIRRVAAIVRLKEVEKDWIAKVSGFCPVLFLICSSPPPRFLYDDYNIPNSISLEDIYMVTNCCCEPL